jgi:carboxyl-terminal processing protease
MEVSLFNGKNIDDQLKQFLPQYTDQYTPAMYQYALDMLFAGTHNVKREIAIAEKGKSVNFYPDNFSTLSDNKQLLESKILNKKTAYLKVNNSLGDNNLISTFDKALDSLLNYKNVIIDLTETPSGEIQLLRERLWEGLQIRCFHIRFTNLMRQNINLKDIG